MYDWAAQGRHFCQHGHKDHVTSDQAQQHKNIVPGGEFRYPVCPFWLSLTTSGSLIKKGQTDRCQFMFVANSSNGGGQVSRDFP
uniref:Uncharacterized protein n=1 Tax=Anguilla anguilla TaxID=7936 RepID=A0A0E9RVP6_ANGAN